MIWQESGKIIRTGWLICLYFFTEARDLNATLESETVRLWSALEEERKKTDAERVEAEATINRCSRDVKRHEDLRAATETREDGLNKVINNLEVKVKAFAEDELKQNSTISELRKCVGVDREEAIVAEDFTPVRETLVNSAMKSAKDAV